MKKISGNYTGTCVVAGVIFMDNLPMNKNIYVLYS